MSDKVVRIRPPVEINEEDLELTERALRGLAQIYRETADRQILSILREGLEERVVST